MSSVFKKLLSRELGENKYNLYFDCYQRLIIDKKYDSKQLENEEIFNDIYENLKDMDLTILTQRLEQLLEAMYIALRISKNYSFSFIFYIIASVFLISQNLMISVTVVGIFLMTVCFLYKTYEFIVNKYCFIDAHIILVYKSVLDKLILTYESSKEE